MTPSKRIPVQVGPQPNMGVEVISAWCASSSSGTTVYEIQLRADGILSCTCPGWVKAATKNKITGEKERNCKHCRNLIDEAQDILDGKSPRVFKKDPELFKKLFGGGPATGTPTRRRMIMT